MHPLRLVVDAVEISVIVIVSVERIGLALVDPAVAVRVLDAVEDAARVGVRLHGVGDGRRIRVRGEYVEIRARALRLKTTKFLTANGLLKGAGKATKVSVLAVVAGICEAVTGTMDALDKRSRGDYDAAVVAGVGVVGGALTAAGGGFILWGAGSTATGVGAAPGVVLIVAGAVISLVAMVASFFVNDDPIEAWLINCVFGERYCKHKGPFARFHDNLDEQVKALHELITMTRFEARFEEGNHAITVYPGMLFGSSRATVTVTYTFKNGRGVGCVYKDEQVSPNWSLKLSGEQVTSFVVPVRDVHGAHWSVYDSMTITIKGDVYADGKTMLYERTETLTPSLLERVSSWF